MDVSPMATWVIEEQVNYAVEVPEEYEVREDLRDDDIDPTDTYEVQRVRAEAYFLDKGASFFPCEVRGREVVLVDDPVGS